MIQNLSWDECLEVLREEVVGRLAVAVGGQPLIFPVNYVLDGEMVVFRTDAGTKLAAATLGQVAFEVDRLDRDRRTATSVVVQGVGQEITSDFQRLFEHFQTLDLVSWAPGEHTRWVRVIPREITGRRVQG
jgi:nitroimidazol reductase NimA-like FMN-containing flavoprotein (pyridoxamine 5'-phosphate oxidase superfamily)